MPLITPDSDWVGPSELPDLRWCRTVAIDSEERDGGLSTERGPGWAYHDGHVCGVSAAWRQDGETRSVYLPLRHPDSQCFDPDAMRRWLVDHFAAWDRVVFQNAPYDLGWFKTELGVEPPAMPDDTNAMAVMLDENRLSYQLDDLARWRGVPVKDTDLLREAGAAYGYHGKELMANLWRLPARYAGPYAEQDAVTTLLLFESMMPDLEREKVVSAYDLERELIPMVIEMRRRGIRIDVDLAEQNRDRLYEMRDEECRRVSDELGTTFGIDEARSPQWLERTFDRLSIAYPRTATGQGSFTSGKVDGWMQHSEHWLPRAVAHVRKCHEAAHKVLQGFILDFAHRGRLHAEINQYRSERGGTRSYRFSYSNPPLQQMPERDELVAPLVRAVFCAEPGEVWGTHDYSQQEYRMIVHAAAVLRCARVDEAVQRYVDDPDTDFHGLVVDWTELDRKSAKDTNFAKAFGAGVPKFAEMINRSRVEAQEIYDTYDAELPFVSEAAGKVEKLAQRRGYIKLIDGARCHFDQWEAAWRGDNYDEFGKYLPPRSQAAARQTWPGKRLKRSFTHKAFNRFVQGSAARQTKIAMRTCWREGIVPLLQMHDELDFSHGERAEAERVHVIMRDAVRLRVPVVVDNEYGATWGDAKAVDGYGATWDEAVARVRARG